MYDDILRTLVASPEVSTLTVSQVKRLAERITAVTTPDLAARIQVRMPWLVEDIRNGRKIHAIKQVREAEGCGLKEAKEAVDTWAEYLARPTA